MSQTLTYQMTGLPVNPTGLPNRRQSGLSALKGASSFAEQPGGDVVFCLVSMLAAAPIQPVIIEWAFEWTRQPFSARNSLELCRQLGFASREADGNWNFDQNAVRQQSIAIRSEQRNTLKRSLLNFYNQAVDGVIEAPLIPADLDHIYTLTQDPDNDDACNLLIWLANFSYENGDPAMGAESWQRIAHYLAAQQGIHHEDTLLAINNQAECLRHMGAIEQAHSVYSQLLDLMQAPEFTDHPVRLTAQQNMASILRQNGDLASARTLDEDILLRRRNTLGENHPDTLVSMNQLASTLKAQGLLTEARELQQEVLIQRKQKHPVTHPEVSESAWNLIQTMMLQDDYDSMQEILFDDLFWLLSKDSSNLPSIQQQIRHLLKKLMNQSV